MSPDSHHPHFALGRILATPGALQVIEHSGQTPADFLSRHARGDWGCISASDQQLNDRAIESGARILSAYETLNGVRLWIITDAQDAAGHRESTTILLPQEY
ncbi:MAG: hypothetical protein GXY58_00720 [Planctomycetaceae bacterium]|nr:hypothetical protein [Planctomycetaceae bacterium]